MKKFLLFMMVGIAFTGFSQHNAAYYHAAENTAMKKVSRGFETFEQQDFAPTRSVVAINEHIIGNTVYDWQTNAGLVNRAYAWEDGYAAFAWTHAMETSFSDRGTGVNHYNGSAWMTAPEDVTRAESVKTGFGAYAPYGANGEVIAAHTSTAISYILVSTRETKGEGEWVEHELHGPEGTSILWPSVWTSGENREYIHVLYNTDEGYGGQSEAIFYSRSSDGGNTWDIHNYQFPEFSIESTPCIGSNSYCFIKSEKDIIAFTVSDSWSDSYVMKSLDNGENWEQIIFYKHPNPFGTFDSAFYYPRYVSAAFDSDKKLHVVYEYNGAKDSSAAEGSYYPGIGGIVYWNEDMPVRDTTYLSQEIYDNTWYHYYPEYYYMAEMPPEYIGYLMCVDDVTGNLIPIETVITEGTKFRFCTEDDPTEHGAYNCGPVAMPEIMIDDQGRIFVVFVALADGATCYNQNQNFYRIYGNRSDDGGATWKGVSLLTRGFEISFNECVYPYMAPRLVNGKVCIAYQRDETPGTFVQEDHSLGSGSEFINLMIDPSEFDPAGGVAISENKEEIAMTLAPNPAHSQVVLSVEGTANVNIYNVVGQLVRTVGNVQNEAVIDVTNFASGVYFITATQNGKSITQKLIVQ